MVIPEAQIAPLPELEVIQTLGNKASPIVPAMPLQIGLRGGHKSSYHTREKARRYPHALYIAWAELSEVALNIALMCTTSAVQRVGVPITSGGHCGRKGAVSFLVCDIHAKGKGYRV